MSVKRIIVVSISAILLTGFVALGISDAVKTKDKIDSQNVKIQQKSSEIKELNSKQEELNQELQKATEQTTQSSEQLKQREAEIQELEKQKQELEAKFSATSKSKSTGVASASTTSRGDLYNIVRDAAVKNGLDPEWFWNLAKCESTWNPNAVNTSYYDNGHPSGLYQHISGYWPARAAKYGYAGASVFDPVANANVTAAMWKSGSHLWECQ